MSRKTTKSILSRDEISLLIKSEEPKNIELYGNLYSVLCDLQKLKATSLNQLSNIDRKAKAALTYNKKSLVDNTIKEWYAERVSEEDPAKKVRCGLCNTPNKYLYYIRNRKNNTLLNVGSHCITKFPGLEGYLEQKKQLSQIHKNHKAVTRRNEFYYHFPDCEEIISEADTYFNSLPLLLPYKLYTELQNTITRMRLIYTKYVNEGKKPFASEYNSFDLFQLAINQYTKLKLSADEHVINNKDNHLSCKRSEIDWMISHNKQGLLEKIATNNGIYTLSTLRGIWSIEYLEKNMDRVLIRNKSNVFKFDRFNGENIIFSFNKCGYDPPIMFLSHIGDFMTNIAANCIIESSFSYDSTDIMKVSSIRNLKSNLTSILSYIEVMVDPMNYAFIFDDNTNSLLLVRKGDKAIRYFNLFEFMNAYSKKILLTDEKIKKYLYSICIGSSRTNWITRDAQVQQGIEEKINKLYKDYKEKHDRYFWA